MGLQFEGVEECVSNNCQTVVCMQQAHSHPLTINLTVRGWLCACCIHTTVWQTSHTAGFVLGLPTVLLLTLVNSIYSAVPYPVAGCCNMAPYARHQRCKQQWCWQQPDNKQQSQHIPQHHNPNSWQLWQLTCVMHDREVKASIAAATGQCQSSTPAEGRGLAGRA